MIVVDSPIDLKLKGCTLCIGNFDGVHLGHRALLKRMKELATAQQSPSVILSFQPPAKAVFLGEKYLSNRTEKLKHFEAFSPDAVILIPFNLEYARTDKDIFLDELGHLKPKSIIVGEDFRFGHKRSGGLDDLSHAAEKLEVFGIQSLDDIPIKSSLIRTLLVEAKVEKAAQFLGYSYQASGTVIEGDKRGRSIGFPTANVDVSEKKALPLGVFAVKVDTLKGKFKGMANVGPRPSFPDTAPSLEVFIFDFDSDLYGQEIGVSFESFIRKQVKFSSLDEVKAQLTDDENKARALLT